MGVHAFVRALEMLPKLQHAIDSLARGAQTLHTLLEGVSQEQARWRPAPEKWAIVEVAHHVADEETLDFRPRLQSLLADPAAAWPPIDPQGWCRDRKYIEGRLDAALASFLVERAQSLAWLRALDAFDNDRAHNHPKLGTLRAGDLLAAWIDHDLLHARQILHLHHAWHAQRSQPYSTGYAGTW